MRGVQEFMGLTSLQKLRLDSCGALELPGSLAQLQHLSSVSLRQCRLDGIGCLNHLLSMPTLEVTPLSCPSSRSLHLLDAQHSHSAQQCFPFQAPCISHI